MLWQIVEHSASMVGTTFGSERTGVLHSGVGGYTDRKGELHEHLKRHRWWGRVASSCMWARAEGSLDRVQLPVSQEGVGTGFLHP